MVLGLNIVKMTVLPKAIYGFNAVCIKITMTFLAKIENPILTFLWNLKGPPNNQKILF